MASAEVLRFRPISGTFPEIPFDAHGNTTWVKFIDDSFEEWCGIFGGGVTSSSLATCSSEARHAFVVSAGQGYFVDINARHVIQKTKSDQITAASFIPGSYSVVACDWTNIYILGVDGSIWDSGRVSFDGIGFTDVTERQVLGRVNDLSDDGAEFRLSLNPVLYECSWRFQQ
jgi:hypothetical protein